MIQNVYAREVVSLNGSWRAIVDPYETGYYDIFRRPNPRGFFRNHKPRHAADRVEYDFDTSELLRVPGDWNSQQARLFFYEGSVWYKRDFPMSPRAGRRIFVHFGGANYETRVWMNEKPLGVHEGGFGPFAFEVTELLCGGGNFLVAKVDNRRRRGGVPTLDADWWNYGGLTRDVLLVDVPETFVCDYAVQLERGSRRQGVGKVRLDGADREQRVRVRIPEAGVDVSARSDADGLARVAFEADFELWSPESPRLYRVEVEAETDRVVDRIGFRSIETRGHDILLNGERIFLRGISLHEEAPGREGRAHSAEDARTLLGWARELGCNFVRLAHYPHNEHTVRVADELGLLVWAEVPVYWAIDWESPETLANAKQQLGELIGRDHNRASVILWSIANETSPGAARDAFLAELARHARALDPTRLVTAALFSRALDPEHVTIDDPLGEQLDVLACNEYLGWYAPFPEGEEVEWKTAYAKPLVMSELGGGALHGYRGDPGAIWTEDFQAELYRRQIRMLEKIPFLRGMTPWILKDFRSPKRLLPGIQDYWNRKGLLSDRGHRKRAFYVLRDFYRRLASAG